jgi:hypothetical protein
MHIHKIEKNKHKDFLLQNRIDPITGDLIVENDEVVFCASCKSVFLVDTWLYLNGNHCEQSETLEKFPSSSVIHLKVEETILFYQSLPNFPKTQSEIPAQAKKKPWNKTRNKISSIQGFFRHPSVRIIEIIAWITGIILFFAYQSPFVMVAFLLTFLLKTTEIVHNWYFGNQSTSVHKLFKSNTFYITNKSICFSEAYGMNIYSLPKEKIDKIDFDERGYLDFAYCTIYYEEKELQFSLPPNIFQNLVPFINALKLSTGSINLPVHIKSRSKKMTSYVQRLIVEGNTNFKLKQMEIE